MSFDLLEDVPPAPPPKRPPDPEPEFAPQPEPTPEFRRTPVLGRAMPHSIEAEEYLLSCCLLDGEDVVARCDEAKVGPQSFHVSAHGMVYEIIKDLFDAHLPISLEVVAEELKKQKKLDVVGGYPFLTQVTSRIPTTAQAGYFIEKVKELHTLREIIRAGTGAVERAYDYSGDLHEFTHEVRARMDAALSGAYGITDLLQARHFDPKKPIKPARVAYYLGKTPICTAGNITAIVAGVKAGKSAVTAAMMAAAMDPTQALDCLGVHGWNKDGKPLLHFDTEQSEPDWQTLLHSAAKRAQAPTPAWLHSYHLTGLPAPHCREAVKLAMRYHARKAGGIFAVIIDGVADLVSDPNSTEECFPFVAELHGDAIAFDCPIICILHHNPGTEKSRGHLGSQLERKAESNIILEKGDDGVTTMWAPKQRKAAIPKSQGRRFAWSDEKGMHVSVGGAGAEPTKKEASKFKESFSREEQVSFYPASMSEPEPRGVIFKRAQEASHISPRQLERLRQDFLKNGWIQQEDGTGLYRRTADGDLWARRKHKEPAAPDEPAEQQQELRPGVDY